MKPLHYTGTKLADKPVTIQRGTSKETINPYIPNVELMRAVNLAILLQRPLLVMGEPGCGKSKLAQAVAYELYHDQQDGGIKVDYRDYYQEWFVKSTAKAQEGLYEYDNIRRLADAQIARTNDDRDKLLNTQYWKLGPMGKAFDDSKTPDRRVVLLIDEIDKADLDFPNDLLNEIDNGKFKISETDETIEAKEKPIVIITSNAEKDLPDAFLRRCLYHFIEFDASKLTDIVRSRFHINGKTETLEETKATTDFIQTAQTTFLAIRERIKKEKEIFGGKTVSTSEFLDWYEALNHYRPRSGDELVKELTEVALLNGRPGNYPFAQALFKNYTTWLNFTPKSAS